MRVTGSGHWLLKVNSDLFREKSVAVCPAGSVGVGEGVAGVGRGVAVPPLGSVGLPGAAVMLGSAMPPGLPVLPGTPEGTLLSGVGEPDSQYPVWERGSHRPPCPAGGAGW